MAEFRLRPKELKCLRESLQDGLALNAPRKSRSKARAILRLLTQLEQVQGNNEVILELPDKEDM